MFANNNNNNRYEKDTCNTNTYTPNILLADTEKRPALSPCKAQHKTQRHSPETSKNRNRIRQNKQGVQPLRIYVQRQTDKILLLRRVRNRIQEMAIQKIQGRRLLLLPEQSRILDKP